MPSVPNYTRALDDLFVTTMAAAQDDLFDQVFGEYPFWRDLREKGHAEPGSGGELIEERLLYGQNETITWIDRTGTVSLSDTKYATVAFYPWRTMAGNIYRSREDDLINRGKYKIRDLISDKQMVLKKSMQKEMERILFIDGSGMMEPNGIANIVDATAMASQTGYGGTTNLSAATYPWWRNQYKAATGAASVYLLSDMTALANDCSKGQDSEVPNYIITTQSVWELLEQELLSRAYQVTDSKTELGVKKLFWRGIPIIWSDYCASGRMYMLNLDYLKLRYDPAMNFEPTGWKEIPNQPFDKVMQVVWRGQLTVRNRQRQGVMVSISA